MFSNLATKVALKKVGLPSDTFDFSSWKTGSSSNSDRKPSKKITKSQPVADDVNGNNNKAWPEWMSVRSLPLTVQPWLTPRPPPIPIAEPPRAGDLAPLDRERRLVLGDGRKVLVVFLRCVGCAFAQKTFLALRKLSKTHPPPTLTCIAISHSSAAATRKWIDLLPRDGGGSGAGNVQIVIDESRALYAAWGLGLGGLWYVLHPASQVAGFKEKGWLGERVARALPAAGAGLGSSGSRGGGGVGDGAGRGRRGGGVGVGVGAVGGRLGMEEEEEEGGPGTVMGNKWQQAGAWAVDGRGKVVWGGRAARADDVMDLEAAVKALGL